MGSNSWSSNLLLESENWIIKLSFSASMRCNMTTLTSKTQQHTITKGGTYGVLCAYGFRLLVIKGLSKRQQGTITNNLHGFMRRSPCSKTHSGMKTHVWSDPAMCGCVMQSAQRNNYLMGWHLLCRQYEKLLRKHALERICAGVCITKASRR